MDGMWKSLPDDCVKNIMSYWSPLNAHELRVYLIIEKYRNELKELRREFINRGYNEYKYTFIPYQKYKLYTNLWMKMVKDSKWFDNVKEHGSKDFWGTDNLPDIAMEIDNVKITKKSIIIERIGNKPANMGKRLKNIYMVEEYDCDWRKVMKEHRADPNFPFAYNDYQRTNIHKKVEQQYKTYENMIQQILMTLDMFIFDWTHKDERKWYLWRYNS